LDGAASLDRRDQQHAIDGHQQRIGDGVFLFTPSNVSISTELDKAAAMSSGAYWQAS
jgi:cell division inhibitor SepF